MEDILKKIEEILYRETSIINPEDVNTLMNVFKEELKSCE